MARMAIWDRCKDKVRGWRPFRSRKRSKSRAHGQDGEIPTRSAADAPPRTPNIDPVQSSSVTHQHLEPDNEDAHTSLPIDSETHASDTGTPRLEPLSADAGPSNATTDLWGKAFSQLSEEQKQKIEKLVISGDPNGPGSPPDAADADPAAERRPIIIDQVIEAAKGKREQCEKRFFRFKVGSRDGPGREVVMREQIANIIGWVTKAGDIGVGFAPSLVRHIWPCVKALIEIPVKEAEQMAAVLQVGDKVSRVAARGRIYEECYTTENGTSPEALGLLRTTLFELYKTCLGLLAMAASLMDQNTVQRTVHCILHPDEVSNAAGATFCGLESQLNKYVQAASDTVNKATSDRLKSLEEPVNRIDENVGRVLQSIDTEEELQILKWISEAPYTSQHDLVTERRMPGTCNWLLEHPQFQRWERSDGNALMWLKGTGRSTGTCPEFEVTSRTSGRTRLTNIKTVGTGKTNLTSKVIDDNMTFLEKGSSQGFAFSYFSRDDSSRNSALACLRSLVRQLSTSPGRQGYMRSTLRDLWQECRRKDQEMNWVLCKKELAESLRSFTRTTVLVDALDECAEEDQIKLVELFRHLMATSNRFRVFISGRPNGDIHHAFSSCGSDIVEIGVEDNQGDIEKFIHEETKTHPKWDTFKPETRDSVIRVLRERSQGM